MRTAVLRRDPRLADKIVVLNNFELPDFDDADRHQTEATSPLPHRDDRLRIVFTGNVGRFQSLDSVVSAVLQAADDSALELVLMGEGGAKRDLQSLVESAPAERRARVLLLPHGSPSQARALAETADFGLVSLMPGVIDYAYPSKTATYLAASLPVLAVVEPRSELARMVVDEQVGAVLPRDTEGIRDALRDLETDREGRRAMRTRALEVWTKEMSADEILPRWESLLERVTLS
jgi:glycosyltransferase involved in cell wall biosynthesis